MNDKTEFLKTIDNTWFSLLKLVEMLYDLYFEELVEKEKNPELRKAIEDSDDFLFAW